MLNGENFKAFPLKLEKRQGCPLLSTTLNIVLEITARAKEQMKEQKGIQTGKEEIKLPPLADNRVPLHFKRP